MKLNLTAEEVQYLITSLYISERALNRREQTITTIDRLYCFKLLRDKLEDELLSI
jgi:hypothetical protein